MHDALESRFLSSKKAMATWSYWWVYSNRSSLKGFIENTNNKDQLINICLLILESLFINGTKYHLSKTTREELKKDDAREEFKNLIT